MNSTTRFRIVGVAVLWSIIAAAAFSGWLIGHGLAAMRISELKEQLAGSVQSQRTCGTGLELNEARGSYPFEAMVKEILPGVPEQPHLRELLTTR